MNDNKQLTRILAIMGTVLVWIPILFPIVFTLIRLIQSGMFRFDYLMPAELFSVVLVGGGLLLWAAIRARRWNKVVAWGLVAIVVLLGGSQGLAVVTGMASGETPATGIWWILALSMIIAYSLVVILLGVVGIRLILDLYKKPSAL